jgi:hypothetical protein
MSDQSERQPDRPSASNKSPREHASGLHVQPPPASTEKKETSHPTLSERLSKLWPLWGILLLPLSLAVVSAVGYVQGIHSPEFVITVQPFEISPESHNQASLSGKSASDIVVDILNDAARHAAKFHGTDYYQYVGAGTQPVCLHEAIKIPTQTSYGIELKGISIDSLLHLYQQARYDQWVIGGDVISTPDGLIGRIRLNKADTAESWETRPSMHASPYKLVRDATYMMLQSTAPELLGRSYLQQANYVEAEKVFRGWASADPRNWRPTYYLSLVYGYQGKVQEASNLADWSQRIQRNEANNGSHDRPESAETNNNVASTLAQTTRIALETIHTSDAQSEVDRLEQAKLKLDGLFKSKPTNADYLIQRARILDKEALIESDRNLSTASNLSNQAIDSLEEAIQRVPENGGLHEQRAIFLEHLVTIMKKQGKAPKDVEAAESDEAEEYTRALELRPEDDSPLWGAVYAQIDLGNLEAALDLARTITLLQPDSTTANAAYIVALESAIKSPGQQPERENEVTDRLGQLLKSNPIESELLAVLDALLTNNDRKDADVVVAEGKRRFPKNSTFEERRLQSDLLGLPRNDLRPEADNLVRRKA